MLLVGTLMNKQREYLSKAERKLGVGPVEMAQRLSTPWNTYKAWKGGKNPMPGIACVAIDSLILLKSFE